MSLVCFACVHEQRAQIDVDLAAGKTLREIVGKYGGTKSAIQRHKAHIASVVQAARAGLVVEIGGSLLERARAANAEAWAVLQAAKDLENHGAVLQALDRIAKLLLVEGQFLATEGPADKTLTISWEEPEA